MGVAIRMNSVVRPRNALPLKTQVLHTDIDSIGDAWSSVIQLALLRWPSGEAAVVSEPREGGTDVLGQQIEVEVCRILGIERFKAESLPPTQRDWT